MNLKEYLYTNYIDPMTFAVSVDISLSAVYRYMRGGRPHLKTALRIERATKGKVTAKDLRGDHAEG